MNYESGKLPIFEDPVVIEDVLERFDFHVGRIESCAEREEALVSDRAVLDAIRSDLRELFLLSTSSNIPPLVEPLQVLNDVYANHISLTGELPTLLHATLAILERLQDMIRSALRYHGVEFETIQLVQRAISPLAHVKDEASIYRVAMRVFNLLVGDFQGEEEEDDGVELFNDAPFFDNKVEIPRPDVDRSDFSFMRLLSEAVDARQEHWKGRTEKLVSLAIGMNAMAGNPVDVYQLEAAVYLHDFGMVKFNDEILAKQTLSDSEFRLIRSHPAQAYELVLTLSGLDECAKIVYQHHEHVDGNGYPEGVSGGSICDGAKILAICDAFYSMTHINPHKPRRKTILRAIAEINACSGKQFEPFWVSAFNKVVRTQRLGGFL